MSDFQDIIVQEPEPVKEIVFEKWMKYYSDSDHKSLIDILNGQVKTIDEILALHSRDAKTTIYRYLKILIDVGFVIKTGRRLKTGQSASEVLYTSSARLFLPTSPMRDVWNTDIAEELVITIGEILKHNFGNKGPSVPDLLSFIKEHSSTIYRSELEAFTKIVATEKENKLINDVKENDSTKPADIINSLVGDEAIVFLDLIGLLIWFIGSDDHEKFIPRLRKCFSVEREDDTNQIEDFDEIDTNEENIGYHDIINYKRDKMSFHSFYKFPKVMGYPFKSILRTLEENRPLTIKEIHEKYYETLLKWYENNPEKFTEKPEQKKENTIYKYIQELIENDIAVVAGRRILTDKACTQVLYTSKSKNSLFFDNRDEFWAYPFWERVTRALAIVVKDYLGKTSVDLERFHKLITVMEKERLECLMKSLIETDKSLINSIRKGYYGFNASLKLVGLIEWFLQIDDKETLRERLLDCFID
ncbi:MAG: hypothetical protein ACXADA_18270 [Candidatus Hodarchaeales archaeon]